MRRVPTITEGQRKTAEAYRKFLSNRLNFYFVAVMGVKNYLNRYKIVIGCSPQHKPEVVVSKTRAVLVSFRAENPLQREDRYEIEVIHGEICTQNIDQSDMS